jgi:hypothetical protein
LVRTTESYIASGRRSFFPIQRAMSRGEFFTRITIWLALSGAALGTIAQFPFRSNPKRQALARWFWTVGCFALLAHVACAYHFYHAWSQSSVYQETARQTAEVFNLNWGGGVYVNYVFMLAWLVDVLWWWHGSGRGSGRYDQRPRAWVWGWRGFFLFMVFNATVVFKTGALRWIGLLMCLAMAVVWWITNKSDRKGINA